MCGRSPVVLDHTASSNHLSSRRNVSSVQTGSIALGQRAPLACLISLVLSVLTLLVLPFRSSRPKVPTATTSSGGSNGASCRTPLPSNSSPSSRSALLPSSASSSAECSPWLSLSAAASPAGGSLGKRRMPLDADVRCANECPSFFDGGSNSDSFTTSPNGVCAVRLFCVQLWCRNVPEA